MNVPTKMLKNNNSQPSQTQTLSQNLLKKYHKIHKKSKSPSTPKKDGEMTNLLTTQKDSTSFLQDEVLKWFFSLDLASRIKITSIKNKSLVNILYQMYVHSHLDPKVKFQIRSSCSEEVEEFYPIIYTSNPSAASYINVNVNNMSRINSNENSASLYLQYFHTNNSVQTNIYLNNFIKMNDLMEREFIKEVKFYKCEEHNDSMILSYALLTNETVFRKYFSYFSNDKYLGAYLTAGFDQNKQYYLNFPDWVSNKDYYTFCQILTAYFEQVIMAWFFFAKNLDSKSFATLLQSVPNDKKINDLLEDIEKVVSFLKKKISSNLDRKKLLEDLNLKQVSTAVRKDDYIAGLISFRKKTWENITHYCYTSLYYHQVHEKRNTAELLEDVENVIRSNLYSLAEEHFVENLIFSPLDKVYSYEDFFSKKVWEEIHDLYTRHNALELMNEEIFLDKRKMSHHKKSIFSVPSEMGRKKKNIKKKKVKKYEKEDTSLTSSGDEQNLKLNKTPNLNSQNIQNNLNDNSIEDNILMGITESKESLLVNCFESSSEDYVRSLVCKLIDKALEEIDMNSYNYPNLKVKEMSKGTTGNDTDTAYSSNISDGTNSKITVQRNQRVKKEKKNFFLYTVNPAHLNHLNNNKKQITTNKNNEMMKENHHSIKLANQTKSTSSKNESDNASTLKQVKQENLKLTINTKEIENTTQIEISKPEKETTNKPEETNENDIPTPENKKEIYQSHSLSRSETPSEGIGSETSFKASSVSSNNINITINAPVYNNYYVINNQNSMKYQSMNNFNPRRNSFHSSHHNNLGGHKHNLRKFSLNNQVNSNKNSNYIQDDMGYMSNYSYNHQMFGSQSMFGQFNSFMQYGNLHNDIINYSREVNDNVIALKGLKISIIKKIEEMIKENLNEYNICLNLYGSFASDLEIESSDIDIMIKYQNKNVISTSPQNYVSTNYSTESIMTRLVKCFNSKNVFDVVNAIYTATVPVIKLQIDISALLDEKESALLVGFRESYNYKNYKFSIEELDKVKIDLTFMDITKSSLGFNILESPSQQAVDYIKNSLLCFPEIKPIMHVMKRFLQVNELNCSFKGGMSSFGLFLIIFAFMKMKKFNPSINFSNLGNLLVEFLDFYSNFNFNYTFIDVNSASPFIMNNDLLDQVPLILDPITYLNVGKSSYKIEEVKQSFIKSSNFIYRTLFNFNFSSEKSQNIIHSLFDQKEK